MNDRHRRLILLFIGFGLALLSQLKGRVVSKEGDVAAFLPSGYQSRGQVVFRLQGDQVTPGVYMISSTAHPESVINMALQFYTQETGKRGLRTRYVYSGDVLNLSALDGKNAEIITNGMGIREKMLLGIPLDPNRMDAPDWENLPGVGPVLAKAIVDDRQIYGDFPSVSDLQRVPGIGKVTLKRLERYFKYAAIP